MMLISIVSPEFVDVVRSADGLVTVDHTRAAVALEYGIRGIPARVHSPTDVLPSSMTGRFGPATTWGDAAAYRAATQRPPLPSTGTVTPPRLPRGN
jgi:filamentous hemagglutinin